MSLINLKAVARRNLDSAKALLKFFEHGERLAFSKMTVDNINLEKFLRAESVLRSSAKNSNEDTS